MIEFLLAAVVSAGDAPQGMWPYTVVWLDENWRRCRAAAGMPETPAMFEKKARTVWFSGRVQGVGFRATCVALSRGRKVVGWVKNLPDGRVELYAEGTDKAIDDFLAAIRKTFDGYIKGEQSTERQPAGRHKIFDVEY